ncbi:MAG TPA: glycerate kinase [Flavitalea sp.]|nr:glycerate kinase [Flavitalea sp.]
MDTFYKRAHALQIFGAAIDAVHPSNLISTYLSLDDDRLLAGENILSFSQFENIYVAGAGKASAAMAFEVENILQHHIKESVVVVRDQFPFKLKHTRMIIGGHPLPDTHSVIAAEEITKLLRKIRKNDLLIFLLSGGASSLMTDIPEECTLSEVNTIFDKLIKSGAAIHEINTVRKHLSKLKGGQLVKQCSGAAVVSLIISDVPENDLQVIGSGPTVGDQSTFRDAMQTLDKYGLLKTAPYSIINHLQKGLDGNIEENPKPGDRIFAKTHNKIIADNKKALDAAKTAAEQLGYEVQIITESLQGLAEEAATSWIEDARSQQRKNICLLAGGETTVHVKGNGKGGRNQQFALAAATALKNYSEITLLAAGTDGSDGPTDVAGAIIDSSTYNEHAEQYLQNNDAYNFFIEYGGLIKTGATHTNVMDLVVTLI